MKSARASNISYESEPANLAVVEVTQFVFLGSHKKQFSGALIESRFVEVRDPLSGTDENTKMAGNRILVLEEVKIWE